MSAEVIAITDRESLVDNAVWQSELSPLESADVNVAMAGCVRHLIENGGPADGGGVGIVEMEDGRLVMSPYGFQSFKKENIDE